MHLRRRRSVRSVLAAGPIALLSLAAAAPASASLVLSGVIDGPLPGGIPKAIELYATSDIADLSIYGVGSANNGGGSDGQEFTLSGSAMQGDYLYVATETAAFQNFFGFTPTYTSAAASINGDDAIEVYQNGSVIDVFGDINVDGTGEPWAYEDGWTYRVSGTGPDGSVFNLSNWEFSGINALDGETSNATATTPFPIGTYSLEPETTQLIITGIVDGPLPGGIPKAIELYVLSDIADLSDYGVGSANNGGGSDGEELTLSGSASEGDFIYIATESPVFQDFFGFAPDFTSAAASINGDDAIELFFNGEVVDIFGDINVDGTGEPWEYQDGWAYRQDDTGPDGDTFELANWSFSGPNALDGESTNGTAGIPFPIGAYSRSTDGIAVPEPSTLAMFGFGLLGILGFARRRVSA